MIYVLGFAITLERTREVALILKDKGPEVVVGKWNGVGGKVEQGESAEMAMAREFKEETGVSVDSARWRQFCHMSFEDDTDDGVHVFCMRAELGYQEMRGVRTMESERVQTFLLDHLRLIAVVPNLRWLVPMALDRSIVEARVACL